MSARGRDRAKPLNIAVAHRAESEMPGTRSNVGTKGCRPDDTMEAGIRRQKPFSSSKMSAKESKTVALGPALGWLLEGLGKSLANSRICGQDNTATRSVAKPLYKPSRYVWRDSKAHTYSTVNTSMGSVCVEA